MAIALQQVDFAYPDGTAVLRDFSLILPAQGTVCLFGPSGCGKTTLLRLLAGLETPQSGRIEETAAERCRPHGKNGAVSPLRVSMVFQENRLLPWDTALENVASVLEGTDASDRAMGWLERVGLAEAAGKRPSELSGGMQRRVAIARALAYPSDLLILDEPFAGLDEGLWTSIAALIASGSAVRPTVLVTHVREEAEAMGARILRLDGPPLRIVGGINGSPR